MDIKKELKNAGLSGSEVMIYLYLLENGVSTPSQIAKGTGIIRANTYSTMSGLEDKNLITKQTKGKRFVYFANDPIFVVDELEKRRKAVEGILPDLRALYKKEKNKPTVKFYYGMEQAKKVFSTTDGAEEVLFVLATDKLFEAYPDFFKKLRTEFVRKDIFVRDILTQEASVSVSQKTKEVMGAHYDFRVFAKKYEDMPTSIRIHNNTVALVTFDDDILCTVMENKALAQTFRVMFETMWKAGESIGAFVAR